MKTYTVIFGLILFISAGTLLAQAPYTRQLNRKKVILLQGRNHFAPLEMIEYETKGGPRKFYIRTEQAGRYLNNQDRVVDAGYFRLIRSRSPFRASIESLLYFHEGAEYKWRGKDQRDAYSKNWTSRLVKLGFLAALAGSYSMANRKSRALDGSIRYFNHSSREVAYTRARNQYLFSAVLTAGYFLYATIKAYRNFGHDQTGRDLRLRSRKLGEPVNVLNTNEYEPVLPNLNISNLQFFLPTPGTKGNAHGLGFVWRSNF